MYVCVCVCVCVMVVVCVNVCVPGCGRGEYEAAKTGICGSRTTPGTPPIRDCTDLVKLVLLGKVGKENRAGG